jgi:hypothetical protein
MAPLSEVAMRDASVQSIVIASNMRPATRQLALRLLEARLPIHFLTHSPQADKEDEIFLGNSLTLRLEFQSAKPAIQCRLMTSNPKQLIRRWFVSPSGAGMDRVVAAAKQQSAVKHQPILAAAAA